MTPEELKAIMDNLRKRVGLGSPGPDGEVTITFAAPSEEEMVKADLDPEGVKRILGVSWWTEMVEDIIETPDMCEPGDSPEQILEYAQDVVAEYIRKRFPLNPE